METIKVICDKNGDIWNIKECEKYSFKCFRNNSGYLELRQIYYYEIGLCYFFDKKDIDLKFDQILSMQIYRENFIKSINLWLDNTLNFNNAITNDSEYTYNNPSQDDKIREKLETIIERFLIKENFNIDALGKYYPKRIEANDEYSSKILELKENINTARYFVQYIDNWFKNTFKNSIENHNIVICVIPGHNKSEFNNSGHAYLCKYLINKYKIIDGINALIRNKTMPKKSTSVLRTTTIEDINSICYNSKIDLKDKEVILLDDVTTVGAALKAGSYILYRKGAKKVFPVALGKTVHLNDR